MKRPESIADRRQAWHDRYFNQHSNEVTRRAIIQNQNAELRAEIEKIKKGR